MHTPLIDARYDRKFLWWAELDLAKPYKGLREANDRVRSGHLGDAEAR